MNNECNIIDEFDLHYNYLQSLFNYVINSKEIPIELVKYVYDYVKISEDNTIINKSDLDNINLDSSKIKVSETEFNNTIFKKNVEKKYEI